MRTAAMQSFVDSFIIKNEISGDFVDASEHDLTCQCDKCLHWWVSCGGEDTGEGWGYGPFTEEEFVNGGGTVLPYPPQEEE